MGLIDLVRYLTIKRLANDTESLDAIRLYFLCDESPSSIARRLDVSKGAVRGWILRCMECYGSSWARLRAVIRYVLAALEYVKPIIELDTNMARCRLCGAEFHGSRSALRFVTIQHVRIAHNDVLEREVDRVIDIMRGMVRR